MLDRNNLPEFKLDFDNNIVLGMPKLMHLEVEVEVDGKLLVNLYLDLNRDIAILNNWVVWKRKFDFKGLNEYFKRGNFIGGS